MSTFCMSGMVENRTSPVSSSPTEFQTCTAFTGNRYLHAVCSTGMVRMLAIVQQYLWKFFQIFLPIRTYHYIGSHHCQYFFCHCILQLYPFWTISFLRSKAIPPSAEEETSNLLPKRRSKGMIFQYLFLIYQVALWMKPRFLRLLQYHQNRRL